VLRDQGIDVLAWGSGWPAGRVKQEDMIRIFNQSRINLNLSNASVPASIVARATALLLRGLVAAPLNNRLRRRLAMPLLNWRTHPEQIKGRNFEVPGCGGFMLTGEVEGLAEYYTPNTEVASYSTVADLVRRVRCYLVEDDLRSAVAKAGYDRTLREHTYEQRFARIFEQIGLAWPQRSGGGAVVDPPRTCTSSNDLLDRDWSG
jgi:spore maturation protein CgeB